LKTQLLRTAVFVIGRLAVSAAVAQSRGDVIVNVPLSFVVGNHQMQPGRYIVKPMTYGILRIFDSQDSENQTLVSAHSVESRTATKRQAGLPSLRRLLFPGAQVWTGNGNIGRELLTAKAEKKIASGRINGTRPKSEVAVLRPER
jgi:hypothetical protein